MEEDVTRFVFAFVLHLEDNSFRCTFLFGRMICMKTRTNPLFNTRTLVTLAMLSTIAFLLMAAFRIPIVSFLKYEPKDVAIAIAGLLYGPLPAVMVSVVVSLIEMVTVSTTGPIGFFMNVLATCAFVCPAAVLYKKRQSFKAAIVGLIIGVFLMTALMLLWNYLITPFFLHVPRADVVAMLVPVFLPFNLLKGTINAALVVLLYKPLVLVLRKTGLVATRQAIGTAAAPKRKLGLGVILAAILVLASCIMLVLVMQGII